LSIKHIAGTVEAFYTGRLC